MTTNNDDENPQPRPISIIEERFSSMPKNFRDRSPDNTPMMLINTESEIQDDDFNKQFQVYKDITKVSNTNDDEALDHSLTLKER